MCEQYDNLHDWYVHDWGSRCRGRVAEANEGYLDRFSNVVCKENFHRVLTYEINIQDLCGKARAICNELDYFHGAAHFGERYMHLVHE